MVAATRRIEGGHGIRTGSRRRVMIGTAAALKADSATVPYVF
jgi:hypothetical protein